MPVFKFFTYINWCINKQNKTFSACIINLHLEGYFFSAYFSWIYGEKKLPIARANNPFSNIFFLFTEFTTKLKVKLKIVRYPRKGFHFFAIVLEYLESVQIVQITKINSITTTWRISRANGRTFPTLPLVLISIGPYNTPNFARKPVIATIIIVFP